MKITILFFAILLITPVLISAVNATELVNKHAALIEQGCQMGRDDAISGKIMDPTGISLKSSGKKYIELEALIRKEYENCFTESNAAKKNTSIPSIEDNKKGSKTDADVVQETPEIKANNEEYNKNDNSELKLPPGTSEEPFAWFYAWISVVEEAADRYTAEKKRAENLRQEFKKACHKAYLIGQNDKALIGSWCNITGWKEFSLDNSALRDEQFKQKLEQMKQQIVFSEESFSIYGDRDVRNAFDREKGSSFNYQMNNLEQQKVLPYFSGVNEALENIKNVNIALAGLDEQVVAKRKKEYLAELGKIKEKRIEEKKKQDKSEKHAIYLKQKPLADELIKDACNIAREDAENLKVPLPGQFESQAKIFDRIDGIEGQVAARYTKCYDAKLISLTCHAAGDDYMKCLNDGPPPKYLNLASDKTAKHVFKEEYDKCQQERENIYAREKIEREKPSKNTLKYIDIYRKRGGYFINDYNECIDSLISATNKLSRKMRHTVLSNSDVRICEDNSRLLKKYTAKSCSCNYGVIIDTISENKYTVFSGDILALIQFSHSNIGNKKFSKQDEKRLKNSLNHPDASSALFKKINIECAI
jgi:hypothetical protein